MFWMSFTILIPIALSIYLGINYRKLVVWFEHLWLYAYSGLIILIFFLITNFAMNWHKEYLGSYITELQDYDYWDEYIDRTCHREVSCGTDENGNTKYCTESYDCSYVANHMQYYSAVTSTGATVSLNELDYQYALVKLGGEKIFVDMDRDYHSIDGDMHKTIFDSGDEYVPVTTTGKYVNRIKSSDLTVFNLKEVTKEEFEKYGLYDYPKLESNVFYPSLIGSDLPLSNSELSLINGIYGKDLQLRVFFWIYENKTLQSGIYQEYFFVGGNKNEVHVCIGINDDKKIEWVHPFTWSLTLNTVEIRHDILNLNHLSDTLLSDYIKNSFKTDLQNDFIRREFSQFDYIKVNPPIWLIILFVILQLAGNIFLSRIAIENNIYKY